ncbi:Laccase-2 [Fusarium oxysporum f. sp. cubense race 1]|uniref:Laccase-2 n=1 Tax=Fusarium oxysporum f. sp. cubense (strain race 1) TaxID=1229664 RepID=N4V1B4_FUSC1|nr:Laccase-2 [Fusarium oxysporum f. sp. cubense race 1]
MWITDACKAVVLSFVAVFHYPSVSDEGPHQDVMTFTHGHSTPEIDYPYFDSPSGPDQDGKVFTCNYTDLKGWKPCTTADDRSCWLKGPYGQNFTINTDYENFWPIGITREYHLNVTDQSINGDGVDNPFGKVFNGKYPGPWIQACWGDLIKVTVHNHLKYNGTTIHWHGLRQLETFEMDGVNGVTQCPIAPGDSYTYTFRAVQYGTSWYHSHYSLQYADGLAGPITIYGPSSAPFDEGRNPILITDWSHRSAFQSWQRELVPNPTRPMMNGVLINGMTVTKVGYLTAAADKTVLTINLHLHGHDFALLAQGTNFSDLDTGKVNLKFNNPPRRDVALLPAGGYLVVAFKADNPGSWLFHCHIAWHASSGLAIQILEQQTLLNRILDQYPEKMKEVNRVCDNWNKWFKNDTNLWNAHIFQDDSGI